MNMKILAIVACIVLSIMIFAPISRVNAAIPPITHMNTIQYRYFDGQDSLFTSLLLADSAGGVDIMGWPLTKAEYTTAISNTAITVEPLVEAGEFEIAFNNNWTNLGHEGAGFVGNGQRSYMNYTDFRNALNCLVNKPGVIAGPTLQGFATRSDTQVPTPLMLQYVNTAVSYPNYPWEYNETKAIQILYTGGWYNHAIYPTLQNVIGNVTNGNMATYKGTINGVVYSGNDPNGQWGGGDPQATANAARANQPILTMNAYVRSADARKDLGDMFQAELTKIGIPSTENLKATLTALRPYVLDAQLYDWATLGYSFGSPPNWWYSELTPAGIYSGGPNPYMVDDGNTTHYAFAAFSDATPAQFDLDQKAVQYNLVMESYFVPGYCPATYCAYKTGMVGMINELGYGTQGQNQLLNWVTQNARKNNTVTYTGPVSGTPESNVIYFGVYNQPDMINPIFSDEVFDFQEMDQMFTYPMAANPYNDIVPGSAITSFPSGSDLPWMLYSWKMETITDPTTGLVGDSNVTYYFRHDFNWSDGVPFDVTDLNYTIYINAFYGDSWTNAAMVFMVNQTNGYKPYFQRWDQWTCSVWVSTASWLNLYMPVYELVPEHVYKWIQPSSVADANAGTSKDGLHGLWPGQASAPGNVLGGAPFTQAALVDANHGMEITWVGTGPFTYRPGTTSSGGFVAGAGLTLDRNPAFPVNPVPGEISFKYTWTNTTQAQQPSGGYYKIGLADLTMLANAYGYSGTPPSAVPISPIGTHYWQPGADLAAPAGIVGLSDLVTLALHYGWFWGNTTNIPTYLPAVGPIPASELAYAAANGWP
ncbi:MAG: hypothetical protein ABSG57_07455 [Candidatus Bathyarchaeia archaeon]